LGYLLTIEFGVGFFAKAMQGYGLPALRGRQIPQVCPTGHAGGQIKINK
jgi:hypothetical protein